MVYSYPQQQQQQQQPPPHELGDPILDTASNCGSELPIIEGRNPSSLDNLESTEGEYAYLVNHDDSLLAKNSDPTMEEEFFFNNSHYTVKKDSENSKSSQKDHGSGRETVILKEQYQASMERVENSHQVKIENYKKQLIEYKENNADLDNQLKQTKKAILEKEETFMKMAENYKSQLNGLEKNNRDLDEQLKQTEKAKDEMENQLQKLEKKYADVDEKLRQSKQASVEKDKMHKEELIEYKGKNAELGNQLVQCGQACLEKDKMIEDLKRQHHKAMIACQERCTEKIKESQQQMTSMKEKHKREADGWTRSNETLTKKNSQLLKSMIKSDNVSDQSTSSSTSTNGESSFTSLDTSFSDAGKVGEEMKPFDSPVYFNRSDSKLSTTSVRFVEGMIKFIEKQSASTDLYETYLQWYTHMAKKIEAGIIHQSKRHIFLRSCFYGTLTVDDQRVSFSSFGPRKLSFGNEKSLVCDFCEDGWPDDIDHMLVLHPGNPGEFKELNLYSKKDEQGKEYFVWSASEVGYDFFHEVDEKCKTLLLCAYKEEKKK